MSCNFDIIFHANKTLNTCIYIINNNRIYLIELNRISRFYEKHTKYKYFAFITKSTWKFCFMKIFFFEIWFRTVYVNYFSIYFWHAGFFDITWSKFRDLHYYKLNQGTGLGEIESFSHHIILALAAQYIPLIIWCETLWSERVLLKCPFV